MFIWNSCFFSDPVDVGNFISGSSACSKSILNIWKFTVYVLLKPDLENFEHYFASIWDENCAVVWTFFGITSLRDWNENWPFPILWLLLSFQICCNFECRIFIASSFRIWKNSTGIPSPPIALFIVMLPKASSWLHIPGYMSDQLAWLSGTWRSVLYSSSVYSCHLFLISSASVRSIPFLSFIVPIFAWSVPLVYLVLLKRSLEFPLLLFSSISY